jgi:high affinity sulfate transporter 1
MSLAAAIRSRLASSDPPLAWTMRPYPRAALRGDVLAGVTVAALIIPLSIGYAQVAGLPPEAGLYASLIPLLAYALLGSARRLIVGPDAATAALVAATIVPLASAPDERMRLASALALLVALCFVGMRLARLGFVADFLSRPILVGYMTGVGISVALDQVPKILGASPLRDVAAVLAGTDLVGIGPAAFFDALGVALSRASIDLPSLVIGGLVFTAIMIGDRVLPGLPVALPALVTALVVSTLLGLPGGGMLVLGPVPAGLPPVALPLVSIDEALALLPGALGIAMLSFADTALTGRSFAARHDERTDPDRELVALAAADLGASMTSGYPISSSPSRTAAAEAAGSSTQLTSIVASAAVALLLLFLTGPLAALPIPALGAVILSSALRFIDLGGVRRIWRVERAEGIIAMAALIGVIVYGTLAGVGIAVLLAGFNVFRRSARPVIEELGRVHGTSTFAAVERDQTAERLDGTLVVRFAGPLFFATVGGFTARIRQLLIDRPDVRRVVVDAASIVDLDLTAADGVRALVLELERQGVQFVIARPPGHLRTRLATFGLGELAPGTAATERTIAAIVGGSVVPVEVDPLDGAPSTSERSGAGDPMHAPASRGRGSLGVVALGSLAVAALGYAIWFGERPPAIADEIPAPNIVGLSIDRALATTESAGLVLGETEPIQTTSIADGTVVGQDPGPGTILAPGATITPSVATSRGLVAVPDVSGSTEASAIVDLTTLGLRVGSTRLASDPDVPAGLVIVTEPPAGRLVALGTSVAIIVSSGPVAPTPTPAATASPAPSRTIGPASPVPSPSATPGTSPASPTIPVLTPSPTPDPTPSAPPP